MSGISESWIGFDADDTLWHSESYFVESAELFAEIVAPYLVDADDPNTAAHDALLAVERVNVPSFGYGVKGATISMIETAISLSEGRIPATELLRLVERAKEVMHHPVELLPGALDALDAVSDHRLVLLTKGDLKHQHRKIDASTVAERFDAIEVLHEKDERTYAAALARHRIDVDRFVMVGNSLRSDVLPILGLGGWAVHVPYHTTWALEQADAPVHHPRFRRTDSLSSAAAVAAELVASHLA